MGADLPEDDQAIPDGWGLLYPFKATRTHGGPYDDKAFVAGVQLGRIDAVLAHAPGEADAYTWTVATNIVATLELVGMAYGFPSMTAVPIEGTADYPAMPEWSVVTFSRGDGVRA